MVVWLIAWVVVCCWGLQMASSNSWFDPFKREQTVALQGAAVLLVMVCHIANALYAQGYAWNGVGDRIFLLLRGYGVQQLLVTPFLFLSGFGVMRGICVDANTRLILDDQGLRCNPYLHRFPLHRIGRTWLHFAIGVALYTCASFVFDIKVSGRQIIFAFLAWDSMGNPEWYIFCIIYCYIAFYISTRIVGIVLKKVHCVLIPISVTVLCVGYIVAMVFLRSGQFWWYNTIMVYPLGMFVALYKNKIMYKLQGLKIWWITFSSVCAAVVAIEILSFFVFRHEPYGIRHNALSLAFMTAVMILLMRVRMVNPVLIWCGQRVFPLFMYHFLFFIIIREIGWASNVQILANLEVVAVFGLTVAVGWIWGALHRKYG